MADLPVALANLERAFGELESYLALPVRHARDKAGLIQGFEFTFELFWKTFQKLDRNLTSHTYNPNLADEILARLLNDYVSCFRSALTRLRASMALPSGPRA
jgi:hypothetical protein